MVRSFATPISFLQQAAMGRSLGSATKPLTWKVPSRATKTWLRRYRPGPGACASLFSILRAPGEDHLSAWGGRKPEMLNSVTSVHRKSARGSWFWFPLNEIEKSERILVVGGGAAGVEMAAEIKTEYPAKEVTLIHSKIALADPELLDSVRQEVKEILLRKGVRLLLSERVSNIENLPPNRFQKDMVVRTAKGTEVVVDMVVLCTGIKINSSAYAAAFGDKMASNRALKVNKHLQLEGYENIYAVGDCADLKEPKMAYHAGLHANIVVTNIINSLTHKPLKTYEPGSLTFLLSMGRNDGVGQVNGYYVGRLLVTIAKSRDLFVSKSWKTMGQKMPS
ncbi:ferroptosis suppressor protein 1 isoform X3 [Tyto alba]|uniref:ferroptosis suppressor protein 1 isoform X3 n=1 Tax=Tyto alba TaxID=56313 RepID=UPI0014031B61|nr:ferroptosis suppressor protein 1 isoform X3 [Tyto alba]